MGGGGEYIEPHYYPYARLCVMSGFILVFFFIGSLCTYYSSDYKHEYVTYSGLIIHWVHLAAYRSISVVKYPLIVGVVILLFDSTVVKVLKFGHSLKIKIDEIGEKKDV